MEGGFSNLIGLLTLDLVRSGININLYFLSFPWGFLCVVETAPHDPQASPSTGGWWGRVRGCRNWTLHVHLFVFWFFPGSLGQIPEMIFTTHARCCNHSLAWIAIRTQSTKCIKNDQTGFTMSYYTVYSSRMQKVLSYRQALYKSIYISWESKINSRKTANTTIKHTLTKR